MSYATTFGPNDLILESQERLLDSHLKVDRYGLRHRRFDGRWSQSYHREILSRAPAVGVLLHDPVRDHLVLIEQFRLAAHLGGCPAWELEIVAGLIEAGEVPLEVARRECLEEANLEPQTLRPMLTYLSTPGMCSETLSLFIGEVDSSKAGGIHGLASEGEDTRVVVMPSDQAIALALSGQIANASTLISLLWLAATRIPK